MQASPSVSPLLKQAPSLRELVGQYPVAVFAAAGLAFAALLFPFQHTWAQALFAAVAIGGGLPLAYTTLKQMLQGRFYVDTIATLAILGSVGLREYLAGAMVVLMQSGGEALEDYGLRRANRSLDNLLRRAPSVAHRQHGSTFVDVPAAEIAIGDALLIHPGDIIAADGVVIDGRGNVDESALTGEPVPLAKVPGDRVYSGTINLEGNFLVRTTSTAAQSKYEQIVRMVQQAQGERAPINRLANQYTPAFTLLTLIIAGLVLLLTRDSVRALAILVVATPCPLIIATPLAVLSAVNRAASLNIIVKSGAAIEAAGAIQTVVFDKTGTLTSGQPSLHAIHLFPRPDLAPDAADRLLEGAASVELLSPHVLASAVVHAAQERGLEIVAATEVHEMPGSGVSGLVCGRRFALGSLGFLQSLGIPITSEQRQEHDRLGADGKTVAYVGIDSTLIGLLSFEDRVRPEAPQAIRRLREMGIERIVMLTGDAATTAHTVADRMGIPDVRARLQPEDKVEAIRSLAAEGPVMMVGDGINDAPALSTAQVGIAMGSFGSGIATDAADIVITVEDVQRVPDAIALGRRMVGIARQGILFGIGASVILMVCASLGWIRPAVGALCQEGIDLAAILNALRAR